MYIFIVVLLKYICKLWTARRSIIFERSMQLIRKIYYVLFVQCNLKFFVDFSIYLLA